MLVLAGQEKIGHFINWINKQNFTKQKCEIVFLPGYDCVEGKDGEKGFAVYIAGQNIMFVAGDIESTLKESVEITMNKILRKLF